MHSARPSSIRRTSNRSQDDVAEFLKLGLTPPDLPGGYYHDSICPTHGVQLQFRADRPTHHACPVDGVVFEGERFYAAWRSLVNHKISEAALRIGVLHRMGEGGHLDHCMGCFLGMPIRYAVYAETPRTGDNPGVATYTTFDEWVWSVPLAWSFSLVEADLSASQGPYQIETADSSGGPPVKRHYRGIHNFSCWHNGALRRLDVSPTAPIWSRLPSKRLSASGRSCGMACCQTACGGKAS
jgi:hypothetical protein